MTYNKINIGKHHLIIFDHALLNTGNGYHPTSGIFTAPQTGVYVFMWTVRIHSQSIILIVNGQTYTSLYNRPYQYTAVGHNDADESVTGFAIVHVNQGDDVYLRTHTTYDGTRSVFSNEYGKSTFGGWIMLWPLALVELTNHMELLYLDCRHTYWVGSFSHNHLTIFTPDCTFINIIDWFNTVCVLTTQSKISL